jgi:dynein heavy chain
VQRCTELTEICEGQLQFAMKGKDTEVPKFGGSKGPEIENILIEIKESFRKHLEKIRGKD